MKHLRRTLSFVLVFILALGIMVTGSDKNNIVNAQEIAEIEKEMESLLSKKENIAYQKSVSEAELAELKTLKTGSEDNLSWLNGRSEEQKNAYSQLKTKQDSILSIQTSYLENLEIAKKNFEYKVEQYGERVETMFGMQNKSVLELFLESDSLEHFFTSVKFMRIITDEDEAALENLEDEQAKLVTLTEETKVVIDTNNEELAEIDGLLKEIEADINYEVGTISNLNTSIDAVAEQIDTFAISESEIQSALAQAEANIAAIEAQIEAERIAAEEAAAAAAAAEAERLAAEAAAAEAAAAAGEEYVAPVSENPATPVAPPAASPIYTGGGLAWPVPSSYNITSTYGYRSFGGYSDFHTGTDIAAPTGTPVVSPAAGTVSYVGWINVGGQAIIISHGNGMSTMYCHLSGYACSVGQQVSAGQTIGYIGSTGFSTGPHLHFEIRINGSSVDPMTYY